MTAISSGDEGPNALRESGFRANLKGASLADLVQMECLSGRECVMRVSSANEVGYLFFRGGQIVHAVSRRGIGEAAALEILRWNAGSFEPCNAGWPDRDSIGSSWQNLLKTSCGDGCATGQAPPIARQAKPLPARCRRADRIKEMSYSSWGRDPALLSGPPPDRLVCQ